MNNKSIAADSSLFHAYTSLRNSTGLLLSFAYGTPARANMTMIFAVCLAMIGSIMHTSEVQQVMSVCGTN